MLRAIAWSRKEGLDLDLVGEEDGTLKNLGGGEGEDCGDDCFDVLVEGSRPNVVMSSSKEGSVVIVGRLERTEPGV